MPLFRIRVYRFGALDHDGARHDIWGFWGFPCPAKALPLALADALAYCVVSRELGLLDSYHVIVGEG